MLAATGGPISDRNPSCHARGCSGGRVRDPVRHANFGLLATVADCPAVEPRANVDQDRMIRRSLNRRRSDPVVISEDTDRFVQGGSVSSFGGGR
jgi:hypothetical protein